VCSGPEKLQNEMGSRVTQEWSWSSEAKDPVHSIMGASSLGKPYSISNMHLFIYLAQFIERVRLNQLANHSQLHLDPVCWVGTMLNR
jgi:hypothetical protein